MNILRLSHNIKVLLAALFFIQCATPMPPTGGEPDRTPPVILKTTPESGTVNFKGDTFEFEFSKYINRKSISNEITVEPDLGIKHSAKWKKKKLILKFENPLPDSTTIIITLGNNITDTRNNKLGSSVQLAVSTGNEIDGGSISGVVKDAKDGTSRADQDVLLYREPVNFDEKATYYAQTDTGGVFQFNYLKEGRYKVIMLNDRNRNKKWEQESEVARPFYKEWVDLEKGQADTLSMVYWSAPDTTQPELLAVGLQSSQKLRLRFSKEIIFTDSTEIQITDSLKQRSMEVVPINISEEDPFIAYGYSLNELSADSAYFIELKGIRDKSNNTAKTLDKSFMGSSKEDTTRQRIIAPKSEGAIYPDQPFIVEYATLITNPDIIDSVLVVKGEETIEEWPNITYKNNKLIISPEETWEDGVEYQFMVWEPEKNKRKLFRPEIWGSSSLGGINIMMQKADTSKVFNALIENEEVGIKIDTTFTKELLIDEIPAVNYKLTVFEDLNNNGKWDYGTIVPYQVPERYFIRNNLQVQKGFTVEVPVTF